MTDKTLAKLKLSLDAGDFYEAHQQYRTIANRLRRQKKWTECLTIVHEGAFRLLQLKQIGSGSDLAKLYVQLLIESDTSRTAANASLFIKLFDEFPAGSKDRDEIYRDFLKWSSNHPSAHHEFGVKLVSEKSPEAIKHLLQGTKASMLALSEFVSVMDMGIIVYCLMTLLSRKKIVLARIYWESCTAKHSKQCLTVQGVTASLFDSQVLQYGEMILLTVEYHVLPAFKLIKQNYLEAVEQVDDFEKLYASIGESCFDIKSSHVGGLGNIFGALMSGNS